MSFAANTNREKGSKKNTIPHQGTIEKHQSQWKLFFTTQQFTTFFLYCLFFSAFALLFIYPFCLGRPVLYPFVSFILHDSGRKTATLYSEYWERKLHSEKNLFVSPFAINFKKSQLVDFINYYLFRLQWNRNFSIKRDTFGWLLCYAISMVSLYTVLQFAFAVDICGAFLMFGNFEVPLWSRRNYRNMI